MTQWGQYFFWILLFYKYTCNFWIYTVVIWGHPMNIVFPLEFEGKFTIVDVLTLCFSEKLPAAGNLTFIFRGQWPYMKWARFSPTDSEGRSNNSVGLKKKHFYDRKVGLNKTWWSLLKLKDFQNFFAGLVSSFVSFQSFQINLWSCE